MDLPTIARAKPSRCAGAREQQTLEIARAHLASAAFLGPEGGTYPIFSAFSVGVDVKYDFDLFGGLKRGVEEARAAAAYQREQLNAVQLSVSGNASREGPDEPSGSNPVYPPTRHFNTG